MADEDSDDSEGEGGMGNLNRLIIRPPGHSGKAKRGHLCFDASFETGNLGKVELISEFEYDLFIRPDTCNPRARQWFNFSVENTKADQFALHLITESHIKSFLMMRLNVIHKKAGEGHGCIFTDLHPPKITSATIRVIFNIVNISKRKSLFELGMTPIIKSTSRPKWQRVPRKYVYYYKSPDHGGHHVLSICHGFDKEEDNYQFAFSFPFSYSKCQMHIKQLEQKHFPFFRRELLATSIQKRKVDIITITNLANTEVSKKRRIVFVLGRINPGDSPTSFICQGILDFLVSNHPIAIRLRDAIIFKIIPMMNPDGVFLGNHRSNLMGFDLNRNWHQLSEWGHPSLFALDQMVSDFEGSKSINVDFILDLHANTSLPGVFVYGNTYDDVYRYERHTVFPKLLAQNAEDYTPENTMYNRDPLKAGTTRRYFNSKLKDNTNCYTLEVSFFGYKKKDGLSYKLYTEESYQRLGRNIVRTFLDYYQAIGVLHGDIQPSVESGKRKDKKSKTSPGKTSSRKRTENQN